MKSFLDILLTIDRNQPRILSDRDCNWNVNETSVDSTFGIRRKEFRSSQTHYGEFRASYKSQGIGKQIKAVVSVSASGRKAPPFLSSRGSTHCQTGSNHYLIFTEAVVLFVRNSSRGNGSQNMEFLNAMKRVPWK